eukprot:TRINITY_DN7319_c0_g1_i1.p1 TRINITY_DN7319_c0_g1~~TRINITY_DN7319_c0_g1_i1.p1  ORF type:complete len:465 (-),score=96.79 TRINITY_DN7319_c0_g1_i1:137-1531(-)
MSADAVTGIFGSMLAILCTLWVIALPWTILKRSWLPIKVREPGFVVASFVASSLTAFAVASSKLVNSPNPEALSFFSISGFAVSCVNYVAWTHLLYRQFKLQDDAVKFIAAQQRAQLNDELVKQAIVLARLIERKRHLFNAMIASVVGVLFAIVSVLVRHFLLQEGFSDTLRPIALAGESCIVNLIQAICAILAHFKLKILDENFALGNECLIDFVISAVSSVTAFVCLVLATSGVQIDDAAHFPVLELICGVICPVTFAANRIVGSFLILKFDRSVRQSLFVPRKKNAETALLSLDVVSLNESGTVAGTSVMDHDFLSLLESKTGYLKFQEFLFKEFSVENLLFYSRTKNFEQKFMHVKESSRNFQEMIEEAKEICSFFVEGNTPLHINIRAENRKAIQDRLKRKSFSSTMFRDARTEIYDLMKYDSFPRFCAKNPQYGEILLNDKPSEQALRRSKQLVLGGL